MTYEFSLVSLVADFGAQFWEGERLHPVLGEVDRFTVFNSNRFFLVNEGKLVFLFKSDD